MDISTKYMGLNLKNPLIIASSPLTGDIEKIVELEKMGAGAVVIKSLFEEQIVADTEKMLKSIDTSMHAEAFDLYAMSTEMHFMDKYLSIVEESVKRVSIPVIPSINCTTDGNWIEYAKRFEKDGASAIELNVFIQPSDLKKTSEELENVYINIIKKIKKEVKIPVAMKIGSYFTGLANVAYNLSEAGADALVLFNRYFRLDIDIDNIEVINGSFKTNSEEMLVSLQWIAMLAGKIKSDLSASTGVHNYEDVVKQLLAGADTVQLCSTIYNNGPEQIGKIITGLENWMKKHNFNSIDEFRGILSSEKKESAYMRTQYIKTLIEL